jgi:16S rRNA (cytosine1402-N4)-methyltransferase
MNPNRGLSAAAWLERVTEAELAEALHDHSDEPQAGALGRALAGKSFPTTTALAAAVRALADVESEDITIRRVFQAVRIAVNEEFTALDMFLRALPGCLKPGARIAILTFHSGEDRRVKKAFRQGMTDGVFTATSDGVITAGPDERRMNPRSAPAKLRWAQKG